MTDPEFRDRVLSELAEVKADVKELMGLKERVAKVETKIVPLSVVAGALFGWLAGTL